MDYPSAINYLESLIDYERTPAEARQARFFNLARMEHLLARLGNPERDLPCLHIAGTKGKGSTCAMAASMLRAAGYRVGLYTSPHLISFRERIRIDDALIPEARVAALTSQLQPPLEALKKTESSPPSFFEAYTAMALLHFREEKVDFAVLEPGLGGRLDATNIILPKVCGLTRIAMDHWVELGDTLPKIAGEKAGIIKPNVPVVSAPQTGEVMEVFEKVCRERNAPLLRVGEWGEKCAIAIQSWPPTLAGQRMTIQGRRGRYEDILCPLLGEYQAKNAGVAAGMIELLADQGYSIAAKAIRTGLESVRWPGRMHIAGKEPTIIIDGAHDAASAEELARATRALFPQAKITLILGIFPEKDVEGIATALCPLAHDVIVTAAKSPRAAPPEALLQRLTPYCSTARLAPDTAAALELAKAITAKTDVILAAGSLYIVGEALHALGLGAS